MKKRVNAHAHSAEQLKAEQTEELLIIMIVKTNQKQAGAKTANQQRKIVIVVETAGHQRKIAETKKNIT
jgi:hypothetical protein